ncbi:MAG: hypothetical protein AABX23_02360 [Nanoarchaeota archaeon]
MVAKVDPKNIFVDFPVNNDKTRNFRSRIWSIKYWAEFMKLNSDEVWSKGQADLIDSQFIKADEFYKNLVKTEKGREVLKRLNEDRLNKFKTKKELRSLF